MRGVAAMTASSISAVKNTSSNRAKPPSRFRGPFIFTTVRVRKFPINLSSGGRGRLILHAERDGIAPAGRNFLEFEVGVIHFDDAVASQQGVAFRDDVNIVSIRQKSPARRAIRHRTVTEKFHIGRKRRRRRRRQRYGAVNPAGG